MLEGHLNYFALNIKQGAKCFRDKFLTEELMIIKRELIALQNLRVV